MRQRLLSHLTYANVMVTIVAFIVLGGMSYAATGGNFILGKSNSASSKTSLSAPISDKAVQLTNTNTGAGATALGLNVASGHPPLTVNSRTKVTNLNADKLDGIDSTGFIKGSGRMVTINTSIPDTGNGILFDLPGFVELGAACAGTTGNGSGFVTTHNLPVTVLSDNGNTNPALHQIPANSAAGASDWAMAPGGDAITFSFEASGGKVATAFVFSYAFHNPVLNEDVCKYQGQVIVHGA